MTADPIRHVSFANLCSIIPEESSPQASGIFGLHTKSISLHIGWPHPRRLNSETSIVDDTATSPGASSSSKSPTLVVRIPSFATSKSRQPTHSPTELHPTRSCIKQRNASFSTPTTPPVPASPSHIPCSPPPPQRQRSLSTPIETLPLRPCCTECEESALLARSLGPLYKVPWSNAARAKKKRDDAEEKRDILAGLKEGCILKWALLKDEEDSNIEQGLLSPNSAVVPSLSVCSSSSSSDASDPFSQLDGTHKSAGLRKRSKPNDDWVPSKYYDNDDDELDLFPLPSPSPKLTPPQGGSPSSSCVNLHSPAATQLSFIGSDNPSNSSPISPKPSDQPSFPPPPPSAYSNQLGLGLPTILSAPASRSGSRSSLSSHSSGHSHSSAQRLKPSPLRASSSQGPESTGFLAVSTPTEYSRHVSDGGSQPLRKGPPSTTSTHSSTTTSSRTSSNRVWTSSFLPPPLPTKSSHSHRSAHSTTSTSKSVLTQPPGVSPSPLTAASNSLSLTRTVSSNRTLHASSSQPAVVSERSDPPHMPTYSGAQREVVVIKSSSTSTHRKREKDSASKDRLVEKPSPQHTGNFTKPSSQASNSVPPPVPPKSASSSNVSEGPSTPTSAGSTTSSRSPPDSATGFLNHGRTLSTPVSGLKKASSMPPLPVPDDVISRAPRHNGFDGRQSSATRQQIGSRLDPMHYPTNSNGDSYNRTRPLTRSVGGSAELVVNREGGSPLTKTPSMTSSRTSGSGRRRPSDSDTDEMTGGKGGRTRSTSIRKMFKGISLGMGSAAGVVPVR